MWDPGVRITEASDLSANAALAADSGGHVYLMWADRRTGIDKIYYARHDGEGWGGDVLLVEAAQDGRHPSVASTSEGDIHLIWTDARAGNDEIYYKSRAADLLAGIDTGDPKAGPVISFRVTPNPVRLGAELGFHLDSEISADLAVYDVAGRLVWRRALGRLPAGDHLVTWDMTDHAGNRVAPGVYLISVSSERKSRSAKIVVLR
jgi:hypothetical protein